MWVFSKYGFFSITRSVQEPERIQVRARLRSDLEMLLSALSYTVPMADLDLPSENLTGVKLAVKLHAQILETPDADYRYRFLARHSVIMHIMGTTLAGSIDYSNFKGMIQKQPEQYEKLPGLHEIWSIHHGWQRNERRAAPATRGGQRKASALPPGGHGIKRPAKKG